MKSVFKLYLSCCIGGLLIFTCSPLFAGTTSGTLNFTAEFIGGGCDISVPATIQFNDGNPLLSSDLEAATEAGTPKTSASFNITLSKCAGWGLIPKINVTGEKTTAFGSTLFRAASALGPLDSDGYGVYLRTEGNSSFKQNVNLGHRGAILPADNWLKSNELKNIDTSIPLFAVLRCGDCLYQERHGGRFIATVMFEFLYE